MAFSYRWQDLIDLVRKQVKNIPTQPIDALHCDWVSSRIAARLPWKPLEQTIADGQIPLVDWQQDYDPPFNMWRLTDAWLTCTSTTPQDDVNIAVRDSLAVDMRRRSPYAITSVALQAGVGKLRLTAAVIIPEAQTWELRGQYQINPTRVVSTSQNLWFDDRYVHVAIEGLKYCYFSMADDPRAGSTSGDWPGNVSYSGQLAQFMSGIKEMADAEDIGGDMQTMPDAPLGISSNQYGHIVAAFGMGGGPGGNGQSRGIVSLNGDTTPSMTLVSGWGISITSTGLGALMITATGAGGGGGGITGINFADHEIVSGTGVSFSLVHTPNPQASLQLYHFVEGFGSILLRPDIDFFISGTQITTVNSMTAGDLSAWYRYGTNGGGGVTPSVPPTVTSVLPNAGTTAGGTNVAITGTNFALGATVSFGPAAATNVVVASTTSISCSTPANLAGAVTVQVTVGSQSGSLANAFTHIAPPPVPTVTSVSPNTGPINTQTPVTITGSNFAAGATVTFGGVQATSVVVQSATSIACIAPQRATAGAVPVAVTVSGQTGTQNNAFTYQAPATPIYGGFGAWGATGPATLAAGQVTLSGTAPLVVLDQLSTAAETVGQNWTFNGLSDQCVYLLLTGASRTFIDAVTTFPFAFDPPVAINVSGRTLYLYASSNTLYGTTTPQVQT